eukprot:scaffold1211_cov169-Amphora_coffeaeformis.AAC.13
MSYRRSQRSDRDGSFPEPPCGMGGGDDSVSSMTAKNRFRRSIRALKCFSLWNKQNRQGVNISPSSNCVLPVLNFENSWESGGNGIEEDFEVRSTSSPAHSEDAVFDVSQALPAVPEHGEEEEEEEEEGEGEEGNESVQSHQNSQNEVDAASEGSKPSDYSSEFMTDDSTETSGLPWDSSFSQHDDSIETPDAESRIGIRPFEIPADLGRPLNPEGNFILQSNQLEHQHFDTRSREEEEEESCNIELNPRRNEADEPDEKPAKGHPIEAIRDTSDTPCASSGAYGDEMQDVLDVFSDAQNLQRSTRRAQTILPNELETSNDELNRKAYRDTLLPESRGKDFEKSSEIIDKPLSGVSSRVKELMKKFSGSPDRARDAPSSPRLKSRTSLETSALEDSSTFSAEKFGIPSEIIRHDNFQADETKGFFWRSRPPLAHVLPDEELVDTSMSTTEGNRSIDYSDVFSQEELNREYGATGEPTFIHI